MRFGWEQQEGELGGAFFKEEKNERKPSVREVFSKLVRAYPIFSEEEEQQANQEFLVASQAFEIARENLRRLDDSVKPLQLLEALDALETSAVDLKRIQEKFVLHNVRLVMKLAHRLKHSVGMAYEDLVQEGVDGLWRAAETFDPAQGRFATYASWWARHKMFRAVADVGKTIRLPVHVLSKLRHMDQAAAEMRSAGRAGMEELEEKLEIKRKDLVNLQMANQLQNLVSIDAPVEQGDSNTSMLSVLSDSHQPDAEDLLIRKRTKEMLLDLLGELTPREQLILKRRFVDEATLREIGDEIAVSRERIRQIERDALALLHDRAVRMGLIDK